MRIAEILIVLCVLLLATAPTLAIKFDEDVCFTKNNIDICFKDVDVVWSEKNVLKYEFEEGKTIKIAVGPIPITDKIYVYFKDDHHYQFETTEIELDKIQFGEYDVEVKVIDQYGGTRVDFDLYNDAGYTLYVEGVEKEKILLSISDAEGVVGKAVRLTASASAGYGGVANLQLDFYVNGTYIGSAKTDSSGRATITYIPDKSGVFDVDVLFMGSKIYEKAEAKAKLTVRSVKAVSTPAPITPTITPTVTPATTITTPTTPTTTTTAAPTPPKTTAAIESKKTPGFEFILALLSVVILAIAKKKKLKR